jgi:acetylornithine deacetylase
MNATEILDRLVGFPSVAGTPNDGIVAWIRDFAERCDARVTVLPGPEGDRANLFATIGPNHVPGYILSGHMLLFPPGSLHGHLIPFACGRTAICSSAGGRAT